MSNIFGKKYNNFVKNIVNQENKTAERVAKFAVLTSLALVLSFVETLIPINLGIPGAKIGLANLVTMFTLYVMGPVPAICVSILRIVLSGLLFGNVFSIFYSLSGFILSFLAMLFLKKTGAFGIVPVSAVGGVMHNLGQLILAAALAGEAVFAYFPYLFLCGTVAGIIIGIIGGIIVQRLNGVVK